MLKNLTLALSLTCVAALSGCKTTGHARVECPVLSPVPASLMQEPTYGKQARQTLLQPPTSATPKSGDSKP